jgi:hypothetical protein
MSPVIGMQFMDDSRRKWLIRHPLTCFLQPLKERLGRSEAHGAIKQAQWANEN